VGLETVELVMEIEDEFDLAIPDEDAEKIQRCGELHAYLLHRLRPLRGAPCVSAAAFYRLRKVLLQHLPLTKRRQIQPAALIHKLMGEAYAHRWPLIARDLNLDRHYSFAGKTEVYPPAAFTTLGNLAKRIAFPKWTDAPLSNDSFAQEVWETVRAIISKQFGVRLEQIQPETHFINDLGAG
jgi:acyl carrier protein